MSSNAKRLDRAEGRQRRLDRENAARGNKTVRRPIKARRHQVNQTLNVLDLTNANNFEFLDQNGEW